MDDLQVSRGCLLPGIVQDGCVVHQNVKPPKLGRDLCPEAINTVLVGHIELMREDREPRLDERLCCRLPFQGIACSQHDLHTLRGELADHLQTDATISSRDKNHLHLLSHM